MCSLPRRIATDIAKSPFRPVHILPVPSEETESYLASAGACIWLLAVNECGPTTNDLVRKVVASNPSLRAVILTASHTSNDILPAFLAGACGFLGQDIPSKHLIKLWSWSRLASWSCILNFSKWPSIRSRGGRVAKSQLRVRSRRPQH